MRRAVHEHLVRCVNGQRSLARNSHWAVLGRAVFIATFAFAAIHTGVSTANGCVMIAKRLDLTHINVHRETGGRRRRLLADIDKRLVSMLGVFKLRFMVYM